MIVVHHLENSRSQRVLWLLEELGLHYEIVRYARDPKTMLAPPELRAVHPLGKSPVLVDEGLVLAESGAVLEYLIERYDVAQRFAPPADSPDRLRYRFWMHYAEGSFMPPLLIGLVLSRLRRAPMPFFAKPIANGLVSGAVSQFVGPQLKLHSDYVESELAQRPWFAGEAFSAADIQMSFPVEAAIAQPGKIPRPRMQDFLDRIHARPAYRRALEAGGPFDLH